MIKTIYIERKEQIKFDKHWSDHRSSHTKDSQMLSIQVTFPIIHKSITTKAIVSKYICHVRFLRLILPGLLIGQRKQKTLLRILQSRKKMHSPS